MPLYEYFCEDCQSEFTVLQSTSVDRTQTVCSECNGNKVQPQLSTFAAKTQGFSLANKPPVTASELPNPNTLNLPLPRLRSEL
ncbi:MAG: zinc ribbon domain-containing protein [Candidatus Nitrohelix vancouverensis]|uniref:Zinc ribbon domain-containing protein n=1 Tax=Candidatus Nitrohelix vancouverensis TaxID=2705534 RepID=A0A7T0G330_9BACT|nr:MAG: zinc ribbon domain-containing protein [Candidatus Nitrohelix vancouverensis]